MRDEDYWCPICNEYHPVPSMVDHCRCKGANEEVQRKGDRRYDDSGGGTGGPRGSDRSGHRGSG